MLIKKHNRRNNRKRSTSRASAREREIERETERERPIVGKGGKEKEKMHMTSRQKERASGGTKEGGGRGQDGCCSPLCLQSNKQHQFITHERKKMNQQSRSR